MKRKCKVQFYRDKKGEWRWRHFAANGRITADSGGDGYKRIVNAANGFNVTRDDRCVYVYRGEALPSGLCLCTNELEVETLP